mmetsp:Transcript_6389/g.9539  ORF Transcript_6389/g.9539 Transcript_6389/m.9539 type:complete len:283 (+) Transcript_6389:40-888(+)
MYLLFVLILVRTTTSVPLSSGPRSPRSTSSGTAYSLSLTTFDPNGRLRQLEFAYEAIDQALPVAACRCTDGILLISWGFGKLHVSRVSENIAVGAAGLRGDFRNLAARAQRIASKHALEFGSEISVAALAEELSALVQEHTQLAGLRPYGASLLIVGPDEIFSIEPSGWVAPWNRLALGSHSRELLGLLPDCDASISHTLLKLRSFHVDNDLISSRRRRRTKERGTSTVADKEMVDEDEDEDEEEDVFAQQPLTAGVALLPTGKALQLVNDIEDYFNNNNDT